jgi:hypothetical protein
MTISDPESASTVTINDSRPRCEAAIRGRPGSNRCEFLTLDKGLVIEVEPSYARTLCFRDDQTREPRATTSGKPSHQTECSAQRSY